MSNSNTPKNLRRRERDLERTLHDLRGANLSEIDLEDETFDSDLYDTTEPAYMAGGGSGYWTSSSSWYDDED